MATVKTAQTTNHLLAAVRAHKTADDYYALERRARAEGDASLAGCMKKLGDWYFACYMSHKAVAFKHADRLGRGARYAAAKRAVAAEDAAEDAA